MHEIAAAFFQPRDVLDWYDHMRENDIELGLSFYDYEDAQDGECLICFEDVARSFRDNQTLPPFYPCGHLLCLDCITRLMTGHLAVEYLSPAAFELCCPHRDLVRNFACPHAYAEEDFRAILGEEGHALWERRNTEANLIVRIYCPNPTCSTLVLTNNVFGARRQEYTCTNCDTRMCLDCKTLSHLGVTCFDNRRQSPTEDDRLFARLVDRTGYQECSQCGATVEKVDGCDSMRCRCGNRFCYRCGRFDNHGLGHACGGETFEDRLDLGYAAEQRRRRREDRWSWVVPICIVLAALGIGAYALWRFVISPEPPRPHT